MGDFFLASEHASRSWAAETEKMSPAVELLIFTAKPGSRAISESASEQFPELLSQNPESVY
jgi:hypothetical protein